MAQARWKAAADALLATARVNRLSAEQCLRAAQRDLVSEHLVQNRDAAGRYVLLDSAATSVERASWFLSVSMASMAAAEFLALRGSGIVPTAPVASVEQLRDADRDVWLPLARLQVTGAYGKEVLDGEEEVVRHLWAAQFMAARLPPPAGQLAMVDQVRGAVAQIGRLLRFMLNMKDMASIAFEPPICIQSR